MDKTYGVSLSKLLKLITFQRQFTKRLKGFYSLSYTYRLDRLGLDSLYCRRVKSDLTLCYKIKMPNNLVAIDSDIFFKRSAVRNTRGNSMKRDKQHFISNRDEHFL